MAKGAANPKESRFFPRYITVTNRFTGSLHRAGDGQALACRIIDVSRDGLGVLSAVPVEKGKTLELRTLERVIHFQVVYCMDDLIARGNYRWGLRRVGSTENLVSLFAANGFIDDKEI